MLIPFFIFTCLNNCEYISNGGYMKNLFNILDNSVNRSNDFTTLQNARLDIIGELEAIVQYEHHLTQTSDSAAQETIKDIIKEEKLHIGQLFGLVFSLDRESKEMFEEGINEFESSNKNKH